MKAITTRYIEEIKRKIINRITLDKEFKNKDDVIDAAISMFYQDLKKKKLL